jgi:hypothetical protein
VCKRCFLKLYFRGAARGDTPNCILCSLLLALCSLLSAVCCLLSASSVLSSLSSLSHESRAPSPYSTPKKIQDLMFTVLVHRRLRTSILSPLVMVNPRTLTYRLIRQYICDQKIESFFGLPCSNFPVLSFLFSFPPLPLVFCLCSAYLASSAVPIHTHQCSPLPCCPLDRNVYFARSCPVVLMAPCTLLALSFSTFALPFGFRYGSFNSKEAKIRSWDSL